MSKKKSRYSKAGIVFEELEPRLLLSADPLAVATDASGAIVQELVPGENEDPTAIVQSSDEQAFSSVRNELVIIDSRAPSYQQLHNDLIKAQQQGRNIHVVILDAHRDGIEQINEALQSYHKLDAIHIVSHGDDGQLQLGATQLNKTTLRDREADISSWKESFTDGGDLLIYGCNLAETADGKSLVDSLSQLTATDVAASDDLTGNKILGGDWELEYEAGDIETSVAFSDDVQQNWQGTLEGAAPAADTQEKAAEEGQQQEQQAQAELSQQQAAINEEEQASIKQDEKEQQAAITEEQRQEVVFIDESVTEFQSFIDDLEDNSNGSTTYEIILLEGDRNGIDQINETLSAYNEVDALHIISHGDDGAVKLGNTWLNANNFDQYSYSLTAWGSSLDPNADILIYGCNLAESANGEQFVDELAQLTGADVAASDDRTSSGVLGGDWELEYNSGKIEAEVVVSAGLQGDYQHALATYSVTSLADSGAGSLRQAIIDANTSGGADIIRFDVSGTINLSTALPNINSLITIDATTAPGYAGEPLVQLNGASVSGNGLNFMTGSDGSSVSGLMIVDFGNHGIQIDAGADGISITGNWIGTTGNGSTGIGNTQNGINVQGANTIIGGIGTNEGNIITNNGNEGINLTGSGATGTIILGNIIGLDPDGTGGTGNGDVGIALLSGSHNTTIGGTTEEARNIISMNFEGIEINSNNNTIQGNYIGTDITGTLDRGNRSDDGIEIQNNATGNMIGGTAPGAGNLIAFNALDGVNIVNGSGNAVIGNDIHSNGDQQIDLGAGANSDQAAPLLTSAQTTGAEITISGSLSSTTNSYFRIEFFGGNQTYLGFVNVATDGSGNATFNTTLTASVASGTLVTSTATRSDVAYSTYSDTSAYSSIVTVGNAAPTMWDYHHRINLATATADNNYPVEIELSEGVNGFNHANAQANGEDVRFFDTAGNELDYWIENWNQGGTSTVWVEVATAGTSSIDMYYGNPDVASASDADATFLLHDDYADGSIDSLPAGWTPVGGATSDLQLSVQNDAGNLVFSDGTNSGGPVVSAGNWADVVVSQDFRTIDASDPINHAGLIARYQDANNMVYGGIVTGNTAQVWYKTTASVSFLQIGGDWDISGFNVDDGNWHNQELRLFGDTVELYIDDTSVGSASLFATGAPASGQTGFWSQYSNYEGYRDNHIVRSYDGGTGDIATTMAIEGFTINENSANSTVVGSVIATDPDIADTLTYSITGGNTGSAFAIDNNGQITVNNNAALDFETTPIFNLAIQVDDSNGGTDTDTVTIQLNNINDAPVNTVPPAQVTSEDTVLVFSTGNGNSISVGDEDSASSSLQVTLTASNGTITLSQTNGLNFSSGTGAGDTTMVFMGTAANINAALEGLSFLPDVDYIGAANLQIQTSDLGSELYGNDTIYGSSTAAGVFDKEQIGTQVVITESGTINSVTAYLYMDKADDVRFGLYANSAGEPGALLAESSVVSLAAGTGWYTIELPATSVAAGSYWLSMDIGKEGAYYYDAAGGQTRLSNYDPNGGFASPWTGTYTSNTQSISIYANVTPDSATILTDTDNVSITVNPINDAPVARDDRIGLVFDGVDDYVRIGDYAGLNVTTNLTMEAWIKPTGLGTGSKIIINKEGEYELGITADTGEVKWAFDNINPDWNWHNTGYFVPADEWTHLAVTYNNGVVNTYANGVLVDTYNGSGAIADDYLTMNELQIGGRENAVTQRFDGQIDEVRIWNTTRAQLDIQTNMSTLLTGVEAGLIGNWRFDEGGSITVEDKSIFGHHGTLADGINAAEMPAWQGYVVSEDGTLNVSAVNGVLSNDYDIDGDTLTAVQVSGPSNASAFTLNTDGSFTYTPTANFNGIDSFTYMANDGSDDSNIATVTIRVDPVNDTPTTTPVTLAAIAEDSGVRVITQAELLSNANDVDGDALTATSLIISAGAGTLVDNGNGTWNYTPALHDDTSVSFSYTITDGVAPIVGSASLDITPVNDVPVATANTVTTAEDNAYNFTAADFSFSDVEGDSLVAARITNISLTGGTLTYGGGTAVSNGDTLTAALLNTLVYTPPASTNGLPLATFDFTVNDASAGVVMAQMSINVTAVNNAPTATNLSAPETYIEDTALNLTDIVVSDVDSANVTVTLTLSDAAAGNLNTGTSGAVTSTFVAGTWTASGAIDDVNTLLAGLTFTPALNYNSNFTIATSVDDGVAPAITGTKAMTGTVVNDAPDFAIGDGTVTTDFGSGDDIGNSVVVQADGKIVVAGRSYNGSDFDFSLTRYNPDGSLDTSFNGDGKLTTDFGSGDDHSLSVSIQADGKILAAGYSFNGTNYDLALVRYNSDGSLDTSFSGDGMLTTAIGASADIGYSVTLQANGKILVAGYSMTGLNKDFALVRYNSDGTLDTSFSGDGMLTTDFGSNEDIGYSVTLQADGKILVAGESQNGAFSDFALARYNTDGSLDTSFSGDGMLTTAIGASAEVGHNVTVQPDDKILVAGFSHNGVDADFALVRYNTDGTLDTSFSGDGMLTTDFGSGLDSGYDVTVQPDGKILVSGFSSNGSNYDFAVVRYNADGTLDTSFSGDGMLTTAIGSGDDIGQSIALQPDGKILVVGQSDNGVDKDIALVRYNADGTLDLTFDPVTTLDGNPTFIEDGAAVVLDVDVDVSDTELDALNSGLGNYDGASLTLVRNGGASAEDVIAFNDGNGITFSGGNLIKNSQVIASFDTTSTPGELVVNFTDANGETPTSADVDNILRQVTYVNSSDTPPASVQIDWTFNDGNTGVQGSGGALIASGSTIVNITAVNDAPLATNLNASETYTEDTALNLTDIVVSDVDSANVTATLTLSDVGAGTLSTGTSNAVTSTYNPVTGVWTASGAKADVNILLAGVTFTPTPNYNSDFNILTSVDDGVAPAITGTKVMTATPVDDPAVIGGAISYVGNEGDAVGGTMTATDVEGLADGTYFTVTVPAANGTANIDAATGAWTFVPTDPNWFGSDSFTVTVTDDLGGTTTQVVNITLANVNDEPVATANTVTTQEGNAYTFNSTDFTFSDVEGDGLVSARITNILGSGTLTHSGGTPVVSGDTLTAAQLNTLVYTPPASTNGSPLATFDFTVNDADLGVITAQMDINVTPVNDAPTATNLSAAETYIEDTALNLTDIVVSDVDSANVTATLTLSDAGAGALSTGTSNAVTSTYNPLTGVWTASGAKADVNTLLAGVIFTPTPNYNSNFNILTSVDDGVASAITGTKVMTATPVNDPANIGGVDTGNVTEDDDPDLDTYLETSGSLTIIDPDAGEANFVDLSPGVYGGIYGVITLNVAGDWDYAANNSQPAIQNLAAGATLTDTITISSVDGTTHDIVITIMGTNDAPVAGNDVASVNEAGSVIIDVAATDSDIDNALDLNSIIITGLPTNGNVVVNGDGTITYTHDGSNTVSDSFTYTISDISGAISNTATVNITVTSVNDAPTTSGIAGFTVNEDSANTAIDLNAAFDDTDNLDSELTYSILGNSNIGLFALAGIDAATGQLTLDYAANMNGSAQISIRATDPSGLSVDTLFTVTVTPVNDAPVMVANTGMLATGAVSGAITNSELNVTDIDNVSSQITYAITALPANGALLLNGVAMAVNDSFTQSDLDNNLVVYQPTGTAMSDQFGFVVSDSSGATLANNTFDIVVQLVQNNDDSETDDGIPVNDGETEEETKPEEKTETDSGGLTDGAAGYVPFGGTSAPQKPAPVLSINPVHEKPEQARPVEKEEVVSEVEERKVETFSAVQVKSMDALWSAIDKMKQEMGGTSGEKMSPTEFKVAAAKSSGVVLTAGVVAWILRSGALLSSLMSTIPLWRGYDPLPILAYKDDEEKEDEIHEDKIPTSLEELQKLKKLKEKKAKEIDVDSIFGGSAIRE